MAEAGEPVMVKIPVNHPRYETVFQVPPPPPPPPPPSASPSIPPPQSSLFHSSGYHHPPPPPPPPSFHAIPVGYQSHHWPVVVEGVPVRQPPLPFCGIGVGWALFLSGFLLAAIPWYVGAFILMLISLDYREKPGLVACTVGAAFATIPIILKTFKVGLFW